MPSVQSGSASAGSPGAGGVLIVGGGQAAMHLAFLSGNADPATLEFRSVERCERDRITVLTGQRVTQVRATAPG